MFMPDNDGLPSVDSSVKPMFFQQTQASINTYLINGLLDLEKEIAFCGDRVLDQLVVKRTGDGWLGMVKASKGGRPCVAFVSGDTYAGTLELAGEFARRACFTWQVDKWPSKQVKGA